MALAEEVLEYKLAKEIRDKLELDLKTNIDLTDDARVVDVVIGRYFEVPKGVVLCVWSAHPLGATLDRGQGSAEQWASRGARYQPWTMPTESSMGSRWMRWAGTVQVRSVLTGHTQAEALGVIELTVNRFPGRRHVVTYLIATSS